MLMGCKPRAAIPDEMPANDPEKDPVREALLLLCSPEGAAVVEGVAPADSMPWNVELRTAAALGGRMGKLGRK